MFDNELKTTKAMIAGLETVVASLQGVISDVQRNMRLCDASSQTFPRNTAVCNNELFSPQQKVCFAKLTDGGPNCGVKEHTRDLCCECHNSCSHCGATKLYRVDCRSRPSHISSSPLRPARVVPLTSPGRASRTTRNVSIHLSSEFQEIDIPNLHTNGPTNSPTTTDCDGIGSGPLLPSSPSHVCQSSHPDREKEFAGVVAARTDESLPSLSPDCSDSIDWTMEDDVLEDLGYPPSEPTDDGDAIIKFPNLTNSKLHRTSSCERTSVDEANRLESHKSSSENASGLKEAITAAHPEVQLAALMRGSTDHHLTDESLRQFETWWALQIAHASARHPVAPHAHPATHPHLQQHPQQPPPHTPTHLHNQSPHMHHPQSPHIHSGGSPHLLPQASPHSSMVTMPNVNVSAATMLTPTSIHAAAAAAQHHAAVQHGVAMAHATETKMLQDPMHPALQGMTAGSMLGLPKTRMRTSFDPEFELPRLQRWFAENQHPTRLMIQQYVAELNALESRRGRKPLDINNVVYWFKNARAAYKRQEFRSMNGLKTPPPEDISDSEEYSQHHHGSASTTTSSTTTPGTPPHHHHPHHHPHPHLSHPHHGGVGPAATNATSSTTPPSGSHTPQPGVDVAHAGPTAHLNGPSGAGGNRPATPAAVAALLPSPPSATVNSSSVSSCSSSTSSSSTLPLNLNTTTSSSNNNNNSNNTNNNNHPSDEKDVTAGDSKVGSGINDTSGGSDVSATTGAGSVEREANSSTGQNLSMKRKFEPEDEKPIIVKEEAMTVDSSMGSATPTPRSPPSSTHHPPSTLSSPTSGINGASGGVGGGNCTGLNSGGGAGMNGGGSDSSSGGGSGGLGSVAANEAPADESPLNSDVDMSDDEEARSRDSSVVVTEDKNCMSPVLSPGSGGLGLPPYPPLVGLQGGVERFGGSAGYSVMPNSLLQQSMMYMAHYMPTVPPFTGGLMPHGSMPEERRKRNRTFIDPVTEVPRLEQWFNLNTHPSHNLILKYTEELNRMPYRQKFPRLEPKNVQFWFKNRRAKCKRLRGAM